MAQLDTRQKLAILADAAKYDASCASSGTSKRDSRGGKGVGSTEGMGICHAYAPDGRCISLLKILLTNSCIFDCHYCINRKSSNVRRARFTVEEVVHLTLAFFGGNSLVGWVGGWLETMPITHFWLIHAGFAAASGAVFLLYKLFLAPRLMHPAKSEDVALA